MKLSIEKTSVGLITVVELTNEELAEAILEKAKMTFGTDLPTGGKLLVSNEMITGSLSLRAMSSDEEEDVEDNQA